MKLPGVPGLIGSRAHPPSRVLFVYDSYNHHATSYTPRRAIYLSCLTHLNHMPHLPHLGALASLTRMPRKSDRGNYKLPIATYQFIHRDRRDDTNRSNDRMTEHGASYSPERHVIPTGIQCIQRLVL